MALLVERRLGLTVPEARVSDVRQALGPAAARLNGFPSRAMRCLGVTGTNGKTDDDPSAAAIAQTAGEPAGVVGTVGARIGAQPLPHEHTTPEAPELQSLLARMRDDGVRTVAMEVSSHALAQHRVDGTWFAVACFTNLSRDHLDYHASLDDYFEAKARLFAPTFTAAAAVNVDDPRGSDLVRRCRVAGVPVTSFGRHPSADVTAQDVVVDRDGGRFTIVEQDGTRTPAHTPLLGELNVANALAAAVTARLAGFGQARDRRGPRCAGRRAGTPRARGIRAALRCPRRLRPHTGRAGRRAGRRRASSPAPIGSSSCSARVATATPRSGRSWAARRPTSPTWSSSRTTTRARRTPRRSPTPCLAGTADGPARTQRQLDRRAAIRDGLGAAQPGDVVLIAGKGHETEQRIGDRTVGFDDRVVVHEELGSRPWN